MYLRYCLLPALFCLATATAFAQTKFDTSGRLVSISLKGKSIAPPVTPLKEIGVQIKEDVRLILQQKVQEAIRVIKSNYYKRSLHKLYLEIWSGDSLSLLTYLQEIEAALGSGSASTVNGSLGNPFSSGFNKHLSDTASVFRWVAIGPKEAQLQKKDPFNGFIADYYNATLPALRSAHVSKEEIIEDSYYLLSQTGYANALLNEYRASLKRFRKTLYDSLRDYHAAFISPASGYTKAQQLLKNDWFKQWFWVNSGEIRINPIDWGADSLTKKQVSNLGKINGANLDPGENVLEKRLDTLNYYFLLGKPGNLAVSRTVNKVVLPDSMEYFQYSAGGNIKFPNDETALKKNLYVNQSKQLVIHNIPASRKAGLREDRKSIPNRSAFELEFDNVVGQLGDLAKAYATFSAAPWAAVASFVSPMQNYSPATISSRPIGRQEESFYGGTTETRLNVKVSTYRQLSFSGGGEDDFLSRFRDTLRKDNMLDETIFNAFFGMNTITFATATVSPYKDSLESVTDRYLATLNANMVAAAQQVAQDSLMAAGLIRIYNTASVPLQSPIKTNNDNGYLYYSSTLQTTPLDSTVETIVQPYTVKADSNPDTVFIGKFSYKIGRTKRFTLSAGIAYTLNGYDQSVAKADNGTITITNTNQLFRFVVGLNVYFGKGLYSLDNDLGKFRERWYAFAGVGIPKAMENVYLGVGRDLWPGLKITTGLHIAKYNKYFIQNNQIVEERLRYQAAGPFVSVAVDPTSLVKLLNVFSKQQP